ncbi:Cytochrome c-552 [Burkholderiales bacterium]|nr:MAG: cytochrome c [Burkholderiales bacterium]CAG0958549.1 Cytochrome c-552 [Burkholderiales bacterium]
MIRALLLACACAWAGAAAANPDGATLFGQLCVVCHGPQGEGTPGIAPRLAGTLGERAASEAGRAYLAQVLVDGLAGPISVAGERFNNAMPGFAPLADAEIAALLDYVVLGLNQGKESVNAGQIAAARAKKLTPNAVRKLRGS